MILLTLSTVVSIALVFYLGYWLSLESKSNIEAYYNKNLNAIHLYDVSKGVLYLDEVNKVVVPIKYIKKDLELLGEV